MNTLDDLNLDQHTIDQLNTAIATDFGGFLRTLKRVSRRFTTHRLPEPADTPSPDDDPSTDEHP